MKQGGAYYTREQLGPVEYNEGLIHCYNDEQKFQAHSHKETLMGDKNEDDSISKKDDGYK